ncbi:MAG: hypothetical protein KAI73_02075, partial [Rhodospirillaceae bacterium]|nr:hypothetical protein [Rhodospirillaceae bacterium]
MTIPVYVPEAYEVALQAWAAAVLGMPVNFSGQQAPKPLTKPFATLLVLGAPKISSGQQVEYLPGSDQVDLQVVSRYQGTVSINIFSSLHASAMRKLEASLGQGSVRDANRANGLVVAYVLSGPRRLT